MGVSSDAGGRVSAGRRRWLAAMPLAWVASQSARASTANFPKRRLQLLVAAPPGGPSDTIGRMFAEGLARALGQPVVVENKPGAGGNIALESLGRAEPDGHTLMMSWIGNATNQTLMPHQRFDINRDFRHVTQLIAGSNVLVIRPDTGIRTLPELVDYAKRNPNGLNYASAGHGSSGHLAMELLKQQAGIELLHVPYRGGAPAMNDLLGGEVQLMFLNQDGVLPYLSDGRLQALAITSPQRIALMPDVPTVAEQGFPGFEVTAWTGLTAPGGTPDAVLDVLYQASLEALQGSMRERQEALGAQIIGSTSAAYSAFLQAETDKWAEVIRTGGIQVE